MCVWGGGALCHRIDLLLLAAVVEQPLQHYIDGVIVTVNLESSIP